MPDDNRVNLDDLGDLGKIDSDLLKDVMTATQQAKQRTADDKAKDQRNLQKKSDRTIMYVIIGVAAVLLIVIAYFTSVRRAELPPPTPPAKGHTGFSLPAPGSTAPGGATQPARPGMMAPTAPPSPTPAPGRPATEPVRPNGSDTYNDNSSGPGNNM